MPGVSDISEELRTNTLELGRAIPDTMRAYQSLMKSASAPGELSSKVKELMALAIGIAMRCEGCVVYHVENAAKHAATRAEIAETVGVAIEMGGGPAMVYGSKALAIFAELSARKA
jgi:AhpD family alkylhydroperoxidase